MPNPDDELPDFEELNFPEEEALADAPEELPAEPEDVPALDEQQEGKEKEQKKGRRRKLFGKKRSQAERKPRAPKSRRPEREKEQKDRGKSGGGLLQALSQASPYTVMLGLALLALLIAVFCLFRELARYEFDIGAKKAKQQVMRPLYPSGAAKTTEAA